MRRIIGFSGLAAILVSGGCAATRTYIPLSTSHGGTSRAVSKKEKAEPPRLSGLPDASSQPQGEKVDETFPSGNPRLPLMLTIPQFN